MRELKDETIVVGDLPSAHLGADLICVQESTSFAEIETLLLLHDYSQLPVVHSRRRTVARHQHTVSWKSVARAKLKDHQAIPKDAFVQVQCVRPTDDLMRIVPRVLEHDFVLVEDQNILQGIVTPFDLTEFFGSKITPFILIGEIDKRLRRVIARKFSISEIQAICAEYGHHVTSTEDMTIGDYIAVLQPAENWERLRWPLIQSIVLKAFNKVREERNQLMHFKEQSEIDVDFMRHVLDVIRDFSSVDSEDK